MSVKIIPIIAIKVDDNLETINSIPIAILDDENNIPIGKPVINCKKNVMIVNMKFQCVFYFQL